MVKDGVYSRVFERREERGERKRRDRGEQTRKQKRGRGRGGGVRVRNERKIDR
jgi:hypothetical protein